MSDDDRRQIGANLGNGVDNMGFRFGIDVRGRLVEEQDFPTR